jgi:hypothetical protein
MKTRLKSKVEDNGESSRPAACVSRQHYGIDKLELMKDLEFGSIAAKATSFNQSQVSKIPLKTLACSQAILLSGQPFTLIDPEQSRKHKWKT